MVVDGDQTFNACVFIRSAKKQDCLRGLNGNHTDCFLDVAESRKTAVVANQNRLGFGT